MTWEESRARLDEALNIPDHIDPIFPRTYCVVKKNDIQAALAEVDRLHQQLAEQAVVIRRLNERQEP